MGDFYTYPHLESLRPGHDPIFHVKEVVVTEKIHGTNVRFGIIGGAFKIGSRNLEVTEPGDAMGFAGWVQQQNLEARLREKFGTADVIVYGEWYGPSIQKGITYANEKQFRGFGIRVNGAFLPIRTTLTMLGELGLQTVPVLYEGPPDAGVFDALRRCVSRVARENGIQDENNTAEGIVIYPVYPFRDQYGEWLIVKHKDAKWSERAHAPKEHVPPSEIAAAFVAEFITPNRLDHVKHHLEEQGIDTGLAKNIGAILKEMSSDVLREAAEEYAALSEDDQRTARKLIPGATRALLLEVVAA